MSELSNKVAIVTGASRGIGAAIVKRLASDGFSVVVNYAGNTALANALVMQIEQAGGKAISVQADVSDPSDVVRLFDRAQETFGGVDVLVNNAGIMKLATVADTTDADIDRMIDINLKGSFYTLREAARRLRNGGRVINLSSSLVGLLQPTYGIYTATKAGVEALSSIMSKEMRGRNISVNSIAPGPTATDLFLNGKTPELIEHLSRIPPLERLGKPDDIANVVSFLSGIDGTWVNGQTIRVNGGII